MCLDYWENYFLDAKQCVSFFSDSVLVNALSAILDLVLFSEKSEQWYQLPYIHSCVFFSLYPNAAEQLGKLRW